MRGTSACGAHHITAHLADCPNGGYPNLSMGNSCSQLCHRYANRTLDGHAGDTTWVRTRPPDNIRWEITPAAHDQRLIGNWFRNNRPSCPCPLYRSCQHQLVSDCFDSTSKPPLAVGVLRYIPLDCLPNACFEGFRRIPAKLSLYLGRIDGIAPIMPGAVLDKTDQAAELLLGFSGQFGQYLTDDIHNAEVLPVTTATNIVGLANPSVTQNEVDSRAVIFDIEPVAHVGTVAIY